MSQPMLPFILFALVASLSPGPTNLLILAHGARLGLRASLLPILAACCTAWGWASCCCATRWHSH